MANVTGTRAVTSSAAVDPVSLYIPLFLLTVFTVPVGVVSRYTVIVIPSVTGDNEPRWCFFVSFDIRQYQDVKATDNSFAAIIASTGFPKNGLVALSRSE